MTINDLPSRTRSAGATTPALVPEQLGGAANRAGRSCIAGVALVLLAVLEGCAVGHITSSGEVRGVALGHAELASCDPTEWPGVPWAYPARCARISGGALSVSGWEVLGTIAAGAVAYFTGGAL